MKTSIRVVWLVMILGLLFNSSLPLIPVAASTSYPPHVIGSAPEPDDNPLKGLVPQYSRSENPFPHSMEMFYIPLRDVQTGINTFNWTALDNKLDLIAARGKQAIFLFYLDYPKWSTVPGIPQFLLDGGLTT